MEDKKIKLSPKQKEVIKAMREKIDVFRWVGTPACRFDFYGKTFRYDLGCDIQEKGLIQGRLKTAGTTFYELTELGKTISL